MGSMTRKEELERIIVLKWQRLDQLKGEIAKVRNEINDVLKVIWELDHADTRKSATARR
jgi:hypothetical protein